MGIFISLFVTIILGPVVQNFVNLMLSLRQFVNYISTSKANTLLFFVAKDSHIL